ncbi:P-loop containing nucleoside triphosphate hydrolase protein [Suillus americanus]|nr:P-loop containing nucleoside triphosphate hydrolase protein [Suillus americanus]
MTTRAGKVDPQDARRVKHTRIGVWDLYEERQTDKPGSSIFETYAQIRESSPYVLRMLKDILSIRRVQILLPIFLIVEVLYSLMPAVSLWYVIYLKATSLIFTTSCADGHTVDVDSTVLVHVAVGHLAWKITARLLRQVRLLIMEGPMDMSIKQLYTVHMLRSVVRIDVPTSQDSAVSRQVESALPPWGDNNAAWKTVQLLTNTLTMIISMISQLLVMFTVLREQQDGLLLMIVGISQYIIVTFTRNNISSSLVWAATTVNQDYIRMQGLKDLGRNFFYRKELVAGNLGEYVTSQFCKSAQRVGHDANEFTESRRVHSSKGRLSIASILCETMGELPQIVFIMHIIQKPTTILFSLMSLMTIQPSFIFTYLLPFERSSLMAAFASVRNLYEIENVQNKVVDGIEPFPDNQQSLRSGISVVFRNVSFQYPGVDEYALRNVSFKIEAGQLCVVVGGNGSGKSTILKLISRIYDPTEGTILIDDRDIKTLRLADLRAAMSILFQNYTHFPLSASLPSRYLMHTQIRENIGFGNPALAHDADKIREAARLGGAEEFIDELPNGFDTYVKHPVGDHYSDPNESSEMFSTFVNQSVDFSLLRSVGGLRVTDECDLSGGQMQRLAISRAFMRSLATETDSSAGMLLFDEPSASLDPTAEHADLFERLRKLRGNKTMIFSTHRFGNLTRHADLILYMDQSVKEQGTHDELMKKGGEYARIWNLQAKPFL